MANRWALYQRAPSFVLGFHGTEKSLVDEVVAGETAHLKKSDGKYEWLGHGVYFWENDPQRGLEWANSGNAKKKIASPDVVGAIIDLGRCLDLTTRTGLDEVAQAYATLRDSYARASLPLPLNAGGSDNFKRELDCQVIQALHCCRRRAKKWLLSIISPLLRHGCRTHSRGVGRSHEVRGGEAAAETERIPLARAHEPGCGVMRAGGLGVRDALAKARGLRFFLQAP